MDLHYSSDYPPTMMSAFSRPDPLFVPIDQTRRTMLMYDDLKRPHR